MKWLLKILAETFPNDTLEELEAKQAEVNEMIEEVKQNEELINRLRYAVKND